MTEAPHRFGGVEFRVGRRELGHLHGGGLADLPFPRRLRDELVAAGRVEPHHVLHHTGWVSRRLHGPDDVRDVIALFELAHARAVAAATCAGGGTDGPEADEP